MVMEFSPAGAGSGAVSAGAMSGGNPFAMAAGGIIGGFAGAGGKQRSQFPLGVEHLMAMQQRAGQAGGELHELAQGLVRGDLPGGVAEKMEQLRTNALANVQREFPQEMRRALEPMAAVGFMRSGRAAETARKVAEQQGYRLTNVELDFVNQRVNQILSGMGMGVNILQGLAGQMGAATQMMQPQTGFVPSQGQQFLQALAPVAGFIGAQQARADDRAFMADQARSNRAMWMNAMGGYTDEFGQPMSFAI